MSNVTIYHNPRCSKSRQTLGLLEEKGISPNIVAYLETPPDAATLRVILNALGKTPRDLMRKKEEAYTANNLGDESLTDEQLISAMIKDPILIERPIVVVGDKAALGRPPEDVLKLFS